MVQQGEREILNKVISAITSELFPLLDESQRRVAAGVIANAIGRGGKSIVSESTGMSRNTVSKGSVEATSKPARKGRIRAEGAGRKSEAERQPGLVEAIDAMLQETTYGDPQRVMVYTSLSLRKISAALEGMGFRLGKNAVSRVIESLDYSRQRNRKLQQVAGLSVDPGRRDAQFEHIHATAKERIAKGEPVISSRTPAPNTGRGATRGRSPTTTSRPSSARWRRTASTPSTTTPPSSTSAPQATPRSSPRPRSGRGGTASARTPSRAPRGST